METITDLQVNENDVFSFRYNPDEIKTRFSPHHCFDGQFVVRLNSRGVKYLVDTYWASKYDGFRGGQDTKSKTVDEALKQGELTFKCNLNDVEEIKEWEVDYYDDKDIFNLSYQHGCYSYWVKNKSAVRSQTKMLESIKRKIQEAESKISNAEYSLKRHKETLEKIVAGDISVYL